MTNWSALLVYLPDVTTQSEMCVIFGCFEGANKIIVKQPKQNNQIKQKT